MDSLIEMILELVLEGSFEASKSKLVPKPMRIILAALVVLFFLAAIGLVVFAGILMIRDGKPLGGAVMFLLAALLLAFSIRGFIRTYLKKAK